MHQVFDKLTAAGMTDGVLADFIPLRVENWQGVPGQSVYAQCGVMLPQGFLPVDGELAVEDDDGSVTPCQTNRLHAWPDGSVHSAMLIFPFTTPVGGPRDVRLVRTDGIPADGCTVGEDGDTIGIDTGAIQVELAATGPYQVRQITCNGVPVLAGNGFGVTPFNTRLEETGQWTYPVDTAEVVTTVRENGLYRTVIHRTYTVTERYRQEIDFCFYRDQPLVRIMAWGIRTGEAPAKLTHEIATEASFAGRAAPVQASRFCRARGPLHEGVLSVSTKAGAAHLILPWFREFGMENEHNLVADQQGDAYRATWYPVHPEDDENTSPMNSNWMMDRYWREAAIWVDDEPTHSPGALSVLKQLRFEGVITEPAPAHCPESFVLGSGLIMQEHLDQALAFMECLIDNRINEDYPRDLVYNRDVHNWNSAYLYGHYWRHTLLDAPGGSTSPHACKGDWGEWMLDMYRITRDPRLIKQVNLQVRAMVTEYGDGQFVDRDNQGAIGPRDDIGVQPFQDQSRYTEADKAKIGYPSHLYAARDWPLFHLMWVRTGDYTYYDLAHLLMENLHKHGTSGERTYEFRTDRDQHRIENLCKVAALYGDADALEKARVTAAPAAKEGGLPLWAQGGNLQPAVHGGGPGTNVNFYTTLYMCNSYQLLHEMTGDDDYAAVHRALRDESLKWIDTYDTDGSGVPTITEPNPAPNHMIIAAIQLMTLLIHDHLITRNPDDITRFHHYKKFVQKHGLLSNPWGPGQVAQVGVHPYTMEPGIEDQIGNYQGHWANLTCGVDVCGLRWHWACNTYARVMFDPRYHAGRRRLSIDLPWKLPETTDPQAKTYTLRWPGGKLVYLGTARRIHVMGGYEGGTLALRIHIPWYWKGLRFKLNGRRTDELASTTIKQTSQKHVDFETDVPFSLEMRREI